MTVLAKESLPFLSSRERLSAYSIILDGCSHIYSKNKLQQDKAIKALELLIPLTKNDPYFLAHFTSYALTKSKSKDLHVFLTYVSSLSSADGTAFSVGSKYKKPNLRYIAAAALHKLDPKLANRVMELASMKFNVQGHLNEARHFPTALRTSFEKYLQYRELNLEIMKGIKKAGLGNTIKTLYKALHKGPTEDVAKILRWQQKNKKIAFDKPLFDFKKMTDEEIAKKIQKEKLPVLGVLGALPRTVSPVIAVALLEQATGNQAVILRKTFEDAGVLKDKEVFELFQRKIKTAKTALDRVETISQTASDEVRKAMEGARSESRKEEMKGLGKLYLHIDDSGSMQAARQFAIERGAILAECVNDPKKNFGWGMFTGYPIPLPLPDEFIKDAFQAVLFGVRGGGSTDCFALYPEARKFEAEVDIFISDQEHTDGDLEYKIKHFHEQNPTIAKPRACVIVDFGGGPSGDLKLAYEANNIPVSLLNPDKLVESALVVDAVKAAIQGPIVVIDEIMNTELLKLPDYYYSL